MIFNNVCRICLQDGDLMSVYNKSIDSEFSYAEKIVQVVNSINLVSWFMFSLYALPLIVIVCRKRRKICLNRFVQVALMI